MELRYDTKGNTPPKGKQYLFIHASGEDEALRRDVTARLLSYKEGLRYCLWHTDEPDAALSEEGRETLGDMAVFIPLITENYFRSIEANCYGMSPASLFEDLQLRGVAVLPLIESAELIPRFNKTFGEIHGVKLFLPDADRTVEDQLTRLLSDNELEERITTEAFAGKLFLSYRKDDKKEAKEVMKAIHDTDAAGAAAIWFDEFLVAGRDFNEDIKQELADCDAMALTVTPRLLEEENYVREVEYREAIIRGKDVLPVEAVRTDDAELETAFQGIKPRVDVRDREAMEELLTKAGFAGPGSRSAFAEYLLGMAFFIPVNVEKDIDRAIRLFRTSADHDCVEACEQLGKLYLKGLGVKRDHNEAIRYLKKAFELLMKEEVSEENLRHINRLFYEYDGLPLLLKDSGRVNEANEIQQAFLDRIESSEYKDEDEFILCRVNALTDLANLFYEYDLETGNQKKTEGTEAKSPSIVDLFGGDSSGPAEEKLRRAEQFADRALALLDAYHGNDRDMAAFLRVVTYDQYADLCKYRNDLEGAISYKEQSKKLIEPLADRTGNLEYMDRAFQISNNLGLFYREAGKKEEALYNIDVAVRRARQLEKISPEFKGKLVHALSNRALLAKGAQQRSAYALECYSVFLKFLKEMDISAAQAWSLQNIGGEFSSAVYNIKHFTDRTERKPIFDKVYGDAPDGTVGTGGTENGTSNIGMSDVIDAYQGDVDSAKMRAGCLQGLIILFVIICGILQFTGIVDITGLLQQKLGPYGIWIAAGVLAVLYLLTLIRRKK